MDGAAKLECGELGWKLVGTEGTGENLRRDINNGSLGHLNRQKSVSAGDALCR